MGFPTTVVDVPLRWVDLDLQGHVNNSMAVEYMQEARAGLMVDTPVEHLIGGGVVVVGHQVAYRRAIGFSREPLQVAIGITHVGASRFDLAYELVQDGQLCVSATSRMCPFDFSTQRPRRLTADERAWFSSQAGPREPMPPLVAPALEGRGHVHPVQVRWGDLDRYGHVNNVRYFDYAQEARIDATTSVDPTMARDGGQTRWVVARQDIDHLAQIDHRPEPFAVHTAVTGLGRTSIRLAAEIVDPLDGSVLCRVRTVQVCTDPQGTKRELPETSREALGRLLVS